MSSRASVASSRTTNVFALQPQEKPLNAKAYVALENLRRQDGDGQNPSLQATLKRAADLLNGVVADVNDRANEERKRRRNRLEKVKKGDGEDTEEAKEKYEEYQKRVEELTNKMDQSIRAVIDDQTWSEGVPASVRHIITKSKDLPIRNVLRRDNDEEAEDEADENNVMSMAQPQPSENATALLQAAQSTVEMEWNTQTLTERYAQNDMYADFYKIKWDASNSDENPPPLPHHSMWFALQEGRNTQRMISGSQRGTQANRNDQNPDSDNSDAVDGTNEDTEIQIASENRSCKCPLTLRYFEDPVTSTKCPHSFEKEAMSSLISSSQERTPFTPEQEDKLNTRFPRGAKGRPQAEATMRLRNPKVARCPESGCHAMITENDLRHDPVLLRMTKRAIEAERREQAANDDDDDEEDSDEDILSGTQRKKKQVFAIGSSPVSGRRRTMIKPERTASVVPNSQNQGQSRNGRRRVMDIDDDDEDMED